MDDGVFPPPIMDLDYMDELLLEGCWLQATDGSEFLNSNSPSTSANPVFDPSFLWPSLDPYNNLSILPKDIQEERQRSSFPENLSISQAQGDEVSQSLVTNQPLVQGSDLSRRWWIGPRAEPGSSLSVMERLMRALENIKHYSRDKDVLIQVWLPLNSGGKKILSTSHQPFSLDLNSPKLASYRNISENYQFPADEDSKEVVGLPGRVFTSKVPEWTPDVRLFRTEEFPRVVHAQQYGVRGSLAVPVFDQGSRSCLGVIEVVTTAQKSNYGPEIQSVCKALEAVDLRSSEDSGTEKVVLTQASDDSYQAALPEILEILKCACETHNLPLAQTWVPCIQQGKSGCRHSDSNVIHCISTVDYACYVSSPKFKDFQEACSEHHLLKGQGLVGKAFMTNQPCFSPDVTLYTKTEYPLSHHARISGLRAGVAIRLRSTYTAATDHVLEFFLPVDCKKPEEQKEVLNSLSVIIQKMCGSLRTVTEDELNQEKAQPSSSDEVAVLEEKMAEMPEKKGKEILTEKSGEPGQNSGSSVFPNEGKKVEGKRKAKAEKTITLQMLRQYFAGSLKDAAKHIGVCPTTLKRICRQHGIQRWPSRKIKKVGHSLQKIQRVMDSVQGASGAFQIESFYSSFPDFASPPPHASTATQSPPPAPPNAATELIEAVPSKSLSPSCSQSSSSSHSCSNGTHLSTMQTNANGHEGPGDPIAGVLKRARSDAQLHITKPKNPDQLYVLPRSQSHKSLGEIGEKFPVKSQMTRPPKPRSSRQGDHVQRIKVTYGEEKVRFRMQNEWGFDDLLREVAKRFGVNDISNGGFQLKYLDDDSEWVLLTCDADVEECIDVCRFSNTGTIKLSLRDAQYHQIGSSLGSNAPL